jgi:hypothetical protein
VVLLSPGLCAYGKVQYRGYACDDAEVGRLEYRERGIFSRSSHEIMSVGPRTAGLVTVLLHMMAALLKKMPRHRPGKEILRKTWKGCCGMTVKSVGQDEQRWRKWSKSCLRK